MTPRNLIAGVGRDIHANARRCVGFAKRSVLLPIDAVLGALSNSLARLKERGVAAERIARAIVARRYRPLYLLVVEEVLSRANLNDIEIVGKNAVKIVKQRDDIVSQMYKAMLFLASLLILIFLIEINLVKIPPSFWGVELSTDDQGKTANQDVFIFGFLLIGNIVALLFSSAMLKMFMLEFVLKSYCRLMSDGPAQYVAAATYRFYAFAFDLIAEQKRPTVSKLITRISKRIHSATVVMLPLIFMGAYISVLIAALRRFWTESPVGTTLLGVQVESWYLIALLLANMITLSFYAFVFFPCAVSRVRPRRLKELTAQRATELRESSKASKIQEVTDQEIMQVAERQIRMRYHLR